MFNVYLDDNRKGPNNDFDKPPEKGWENWVIARSVLSVQELLCACLVNDLSLDHDLGMSSERPEVENPNGLYLVKWMIENNIWPKGNITIHSQNIGEAQKMKADIDRFRPKT